MELTLTIKLALALGNGTRKPGVPLATFTLPSDREPGDIVAEAWSGKLIGDVRPAAGVTEEEILTALRSPHCVLSTPGQAAFATETDADSPPAVVNDDWRKAFVARLYFGPDSERIRRLLRKAGLKTAGDIDREGNLHKGLTYIDGVSNDDEQTIAATLRGLIKTAP